jgi:hypothetical protein
MRVTLRLTVEDAGVLLERPNLPSLEFEIAGEARRRSLNDILDTWKADERGHLVIEFLLRNQEDLRSFVRLAHAKYDAVMAR